MEARRFDEALTEQEGFLGGKEASEEMDVDDDVESIGVLSPEHITGA